MYRSFTITNFRCFSELKVPRLERVNLFAGKNNVGKTALLEAIFLQLAPNNPELALRVNLLRGVEQFEIDAADLWGWLFFAKHVDETIRLESQSDRDIRRSLEIRLDTTSQSVVPATPPSGAVAGTASTAFFTTRPGPRDLVLDYHDSEMQVATSRISLAPPGRLQIARANLAGYPLGVFIPANLRVAGDDAERFSKLEAVGRQDELLPVLQLLEPRLRRLAVLVIGGVPTINGDIGIGTLVPLPFMGEGIGRLLSILLAIANAPDGTVLVDEIENGLHHSVLSAVWQAIGAAARQYDVQLFATTHSWECIQAAQHAFTTQGPYDFRLHRLERINGDVQVMTYDQEALGAAIKAELEVR